MRQEWGILAVAVLAAACQMAGDATGPTSPDPSMPPAMATADPSSLALDPFLPPHTEEPVVAYADLDGDGQEEIVIDAFEEEASLCGTAHLVVVAYAPEPGDWVVAYEDSLPVVFDGTDVVVVDFDSDRPGRHIVWNHGQYGCGNQWSSRTTVLGWDDAGMEAVFERDAGGSAVLDDGIVFVHPNDPFTYEGGCLVELYQWHATGLAQADVVEVECAVPYGILMGERATSFDELFAAGATP